MSLRFTLGYALLRFAFPFSRRPLVQRDKRKSRVKWQPAFRLVKVVFVVVNRQHRVENQTVVPVVCVVVKREGGIAWKAILSEAVVTGGEALG